VRGRIVWYNPISYESRNSIAGPWPSMVTNVEDEHGVVTLNVNMPAPVPIGTDPVARKEHIPYSADGLPGTWSWMFVGQGTSRR
jgi:hypothetical protein